MKRSLLCLAVVLLALLLPAWAGPAARAAEPIERMYIVHFSHTDFGFTDLQSVCRELQRRYLDIAVDAVLASRDGPPERKFYWTAESTVAVDDWWQAAAPARREQFLKAVRSGQLEVAAMAFNQTPFLNPAQWRTALHWIGEDLWQQVKPTIALQNDVNGFPRAGAVALLDRGIRHLCMGINSDSGGPPCFRPSAFWWKMLDGRRLFVWLNLSYPDGYDFFESAHWRRGPVPQAADTRYRPPRAGDFFRTDETSLRAAHAQCLRRLDQLQKAGYPYNELMISMTSHWRMDNDPPFLPLADFVAAWNKLDLKPQLVFTSASQAVQAMEKLAAKAPQYEGEFTDWWANGSGSGPREVAASRAAKRHLAAAASSLWGPVEPAATARLDALYKDLCLFDEHTWGSSMSVALPWSLDTQAQFNEKAAFAYRPMAHADWLLSQRARTRLLREGEGLFVANPTPSGYSGWVRLIATCLRGNFKSLEQPGGGPAISLQFANGVQPWGRATRPADLTAENVSATFPDNAPGQVTTFWIDKIEPNSFVKLRLSEKAAADASPPQAGPKVELDPAGWPASAQWMGMTKPLFEAGVGDFLAVKVASAIAPRWTLHDMAGSAEARRDQLRKEHVEQTRAEPAGKATLVQTPHTLLYTQSLSHPRLRYATRTLELWKREPRARLTLRLYRISSFEPEAFFVAFPLPCPGVLPRLSCGGMEFTPYRDQIPGSCRDYFAIDGWADYASPEGHWLWVSRDAPLVTFDSPQVWTRRTTAPAGTHRLLAMVFNNFWYTNFAADEHGAMEFQFDLAWRAKSAGPDNAARLAETLSSQPVVLINDTTQDHPIMLERLFKP